MLFLMCLNIAYSQKLLLSWNPSNIVKYTKEMYDEAQELSPKELIYKNMKDEYWGEVFITMQAFINHYAKDKDFLKSLANQLTDKTETKLKGTSRLIIWDRIINGDIIFEGKGLIIDNDLFTVAGRTNQILQSLTKKNFGFVTINSTDSELVNLKDKWLKFLSNNPVEEYKVTEFENAKIPEICGLKVINAFIISLKDNPVKEKIIKNCLKSIYNLDELPADKDSPANLCNPDSYTLKYLAILFGEKIDKTKDAKWWIKFWNENRNNLIWNSAKGIYEIKK